MGHGRVVASLHACLGAFRPERYAATRSLALYSAAIVLADNDVLGASQRVCREHHATGRQMYEVVLQSYLFLGFPRMLIAAEQLARSGYNPEPGLRDSLSVTSDVQDWMLRGTQLCRQVYDSNYETLRARVEAMAPEVFMWMELEGYGKVLSRPGLDIVDREMAIVACLLMDHRPVQLHSHIRGAVNVGAPRELISKVVSDLSSVAPDGCRSAREIMQKLGIIA
jgi:4-carboxymuconolactone decarboxylase